MLRAFSYEGGTVGSLTVVAPAKINLYLGVGGLRPDGYHSVTTVMHTLELADVVRIMDADELSVTTSVDLGIAEEDNLAYRAATTFAEQFDHPVRAVIEIEKRIPSQAGLGGGSSDASAVLAGLARLHDVAPDDPRLVRAARSIGADCPFLLVGGCAVMRGRGDEYARKLPVLSADIVLVRPDGAVPTGEAYRVFDADPRPSADIRRVTDTVCFRDLPALGAALANNLTNASASLVPDIAEALVWVGGQAGVLGSLMAGSGSAVFALCDSAQAAEKIASDAAAQGWWTAATRTSPAGAHVVDGEDRQ